jgi:hypothetical protein
MKQIAFSLFVLFLPGLIATSQAQDVAHYGKQIDSKGAITMPELVQKMSNKESIQVKVTGTVMECCQMKGCWMTIDKGDGTTMRVKFKDYGFFVPKNSAGKTAVMEGKATMETTPVDELRHYAEDAGKSTEEIEAIKEPFQGACI